MGLLAAARDPHTTGESAGLLAGFTPQVRVVFRAAARTAAGTGYRVGPIPSRKFNQAIAAPSNAAAPTATSKPVRAFIAAP